MDTMRLNENGEPVLINYEFEITTPDAPERIFLLQKEHYREMNPSVRKPGSISFYRHAQLGSYLRGEYRRWEERSIYVVTSIQALGGNPTQGGNPKIMRNV